MKLLSIIILCLSCAVSKGQELSRINSKVIVVNTIPLYSEKDRVIKNFGTPFKITKRNDISNSGYWFDYTYRENVLQIGENEKFIGFDIADSTITVAVGSARFNVGDGVNKLCEAFKGSCEVFKKNKSEVFRVAYMDADAYLAFNVKGDKITRIYVIDEL